MDAGEDTDIVRLICSKDCWDRGVKGLSSFFMPEDVTNVIKEVTSGTPQAKLIEVLLNASTSMQKGKITEFIGEEIGVREAQDQVINLYNRTDNFIHTDDATFIKGIVALPAEYYGYGDYV